MSTVHLDNKLFDEAKAVAAAQGKSVEEFVEGALWLALRSSAPQQSVRNGLPTMILNGTTPSIDPRTVRQSLEEEGF